MVEIRKLTRGDVRALEALAVAEAQAGFVSPNGVTFGQAMFEGGSEIYGMWSGEEALGLMALVDMAHPEAELDEGDDPNGLYVWRLMVDADAQGRGAGRAAMAFAIDEARRRGRTYVCLSCVDEPGSALPFYEALGFRRTGKVDGYEEHEMILRF